MGRGINISLRLDNLSNQEQERLQQIISDNLLTEDELIEIAAMKTKPRPLMSQLAESLAESESRAVAPKIKETKTVSQPGRTRITSPLHRKKLVWLGIVGPSAATSLVALLVNLL